MKKTDLKKISRRWVKGIIESSEAVVSFADAGLTDDEINYIQYQLQKIADNITDLPPAKNANDLVLEYRKFKSD